MADVSVVEYEGYAGANGHVGQAPMEPPLAKYRVTIGGSASQGPAFNAKTTLVRIRAGDVCGVEIGLNAAADNNSGVFSAGATEFRGVQKGQGHNISVITSS